MEKIKLTKPDIKSSIPLEQAISSRRSRRNFLSKSLTLEQVSQLLWSAQGEEATGFRTAPSAGATYPLEVFVVPKKVFFTTCRENTALKASHCLRNLDLSKQTLLTFSP